MATAAALKLGGVVRSSENFTSSRGAVYTPAEMTPNLSLNADVPHAGLRQHNGPSIGSFGWTPWPIFT
jgi:hypothetical protein